MRPIFTGCLLIFVYIAAAAAFAHVPLYPRVTMTRAQVVGVGGDVVSYDWGVASLPEQVEDLRYARPEEHRYAALGGGVVLCLLLAAVPTALAAGALWVGR